MLEKNPQLNSKLKYIIQFQIFSVDKKNKNKSVSFKNQNDTFDSSLFSLSHTRALIFNPKHDPKKNCP